MKVLVNGISFHVELYGQGFPFVLLHGFTGNSTTWFPFNEEWGAHSQLIMPDIIGHGKTAITMDADRYEMKAAARDLNEILNQLKVEQVDLLGYSMGGRLALTFAILFPERVRKLILESSSPGLLTEAERVQRRLSDEKLAQFIEEHGVELFVNDWEEIPLFATLKRLPADVREKIREQRLLNSAEGLANSLRGMGTGSQPSWWGAPLKQLACEVLLITGEQDSKFCDIARNMIKELKKGKWVIVPDCGHAIHVEESKKFGTIVSDFVSDICLK
ncbi:2-succinyl-6-hydroxy-2,4-cyclohexadiene-1-carboxylate synthase [Bacillus sp. BRMEA1]|uniref:2-succinyl-6-hydroxy-2, 4-cyclohexadiene-1-carboxylate synthase n=1 Tax=Neobacillus endophyticus TaxID=2738405 RepID=UPI001567417F|nr:2-succinyl-6-hydroxy-2,4-cyclohexadiene-1-carboxylate synthase [Neobacillus endophyticus]NRD76244.1 2-succinyl-6-hydroxy-2,4-cyclohexadiene-1-carboxylate synthase [Neobacillus endophyticus]